MILELNKKCLALMTQGIYESEVMTDDAASTN